MRKALQENTGDEMNVDFSGLEELQRELSRRLDAEEIQDAALKKAGEHLKEKLEENIYTFGFRRRSGRSEESIAISAEVKNGEIAVGLSNQNNDAFYLYFHEFGTSKMRARPWLQPTFEREMERIINVMKREVQRRLGL